MRTKLLLFFVVYSFLLFQPAEAGVVEFFWSITDALVGRTLARARAVYDMIATAVDETEDWHCGTVRAKITMKIAMMVADDKLSNACELHDKCYADQLGQEGCDRLFCEELATIGTHSPPCGLVADGYCYAVKKWGADAYRNSVQMAKLRKSLRQKGVRLAYDQKNTTEQQK